MFTVIEPELDLTPFAGHFTGTLSPPGSPGYDPGRTGFDLSVQQHPAVVVSAADLNDIPAAIRMANAVQLPVGVQATGHGPTSATDGAVLIDTSRLTGVVVDPERRTARIQAGATWDTVVAATTPYGLAPLVGSSTAVGAVSYTLGGGLGPLGRRYGFAADHVRQVDLVSADARRIRVDEEHEPDLFWGVRGAGRTLGVVTELEVSLFPVAELYGGGIFFPGEQADAVIGTFLDVIARAPEALSLAVALVDFPPLPFLPPAISGVYGCHVRVAHCGDPGEIEALLQQLRGAAPVLLDTVQSMPFGAVSSIAGDPTDPQPVSAQSSVLGPVDSDFVGALLDGVGATTPYVIELRHLGGALAREPDPGNAVGQRTGYLNLFTAAYPPAYPATAELQERHDAVQRYRTGGALLNFLAGPRVTTADVRASYGEARWTRLVDLKRVWDPDNVFRFNQNVPPTG